MSVYCTGQRLFTRVNIAQNIFTELERENVRPPGCSASCVRFYLLVFFGLILEMDSFPASGLYHYDVLKYPLTDDQVACGDCKERPPACSHA